MKLFRRPAPDPGGAPTLHPALGSPRAAQLLPAAAAGDVQHLARAYAQVPAGDRTLVLQVLRDAVPPQAARRWTYDSPDSALAWSVLGGQTAEAAGEARGGDLPQNTPRERLLAFDRLMTDARQHLLRAVELDDQDPGPWYLLLCTCYSAGRESLDEDVRELRRRSPFDVEGLRVALDLLGEKWYGEPGEARALAEDVLRRAPEGSEVHVVTAFLLRDEWFYTAEFGNDAKAARQAIRSPASLRQLNDALDRSVRSPRHRPTESTALVRNHFAHVGSLARDGRAVAEQMDQLQGTVTRWPWGLFGDPVTDYTMARRSAARA